MLAKKRQKFCPPSGAFCFGTTHDGTGWTATGVGIILQGSTNCMLTGSHAGCEHGVCGCCNVFFDGELIRSCIVLAVQADGHEITTIEGLGTASKMHPVQKAFAEHHGLQCGYCTPGMIMTAVDLLRRQAQPTDLEIRQAIAGNLCRCTGYMQIVEAIQAAASEILPR